MRITAKNKLCIYLYMLVMCLSFGSAYFIYGFIFKKEIDDEIVARAPDLICAIHYNNDVNKVSLYGRLKAKLEKQSGSKVAIEITEQLIHVYEREVSKCNRGNATERANPVSE